MKRWIAWRGVLGLLSGGAVAIPISARGQGSTDSISRATISPSISSESSPVPGTPRADSAPPDSTVAFIASVTVGEAVSAALHVSPAMAQASGDVRTGESGERVAYGQFLPSLTFNSLAFQSGQHSLVTTPVTTPPATPLLTYPSQSYSAGLVASYDIFTGGRRGADIAAARATTRAADAGLIQQRYGVALAAKQTFYAELRSHDLVQVARNAVATAERAEQYADSRMRRGTATRADVLLARLNASTARQALIAARDTLTTNAYALGRLVGLGGAVAATGGDSLPNPALALSDSAIVQLAVLSGPSVRAADEASRASEAQVRSAQTQYVPDIKLSGGYNWANNSLAFSAVRPGWVVELGTSYPLFNGFLREDDVTRASATAHTARANAADQHRFARAEAERLLASVRFASENIRESEEAARVAAENLRVVSVRYQNGVATFLDLSTAQVDEQQAGIALVTARYNYQIARASLEALVGREL
jgi:outer membrane protein